MNDIKELILSYPAGTGTANDADTLSQKFTQIRSWEAKYRELLKISRDFPVIPGALCLPELLISECESKVWLFMYRDELGKFHFAIESDSRIVKSLLIVLLGAVNHESANRILQFDVVAYFKMLGFDRQMTPSRSNGIFAVWKKMGDFCTYIQ